MSNEQTISPLEPADFERLEQQRKVLEALISDPRERANFGTVHGKLAFLHAVLKHRVFGPTETYELQSMGTVFGDALAEGLNLKWVIVEDEYGRDPALSIPGTNTLLFPLTMISKRVELGEDVDPTELFGLISAELEHLSEG